MVHVMMLQELTNPDRKKRLLAALDHVKKNLPTFTCSRNANIHKISRLYIEGTLVIDAAWIIHVMCVGVERFFSQRDFRWYTKRH